MYKCDDSPTQLLKRLECKNNNQYLVRSNKIYRYFSEASTPWPDLGASPLCYDNTGDGRAGIEKFKYQSQP